MFFNRFSGLHMHLGRFAADTSGAVAAFSVVTFLTMFLAVGMAVDFMRHEAQRAELQDALDRGVLAAAMTGDTATAQATVADYLKAANFIAADAELEVLPSALGSDHMVAATASYPFNTAFLKLMGIDRLNVVARSAATLGSSNIEISLALDISGSMSREDTAVDWAQFVALGGDPATGLPIKRLDFMKVAASAFVDHILTPENQATTTINLIPFAGQVNPGTTAFDHFTPSRIHAYSSCVDFQAADFADSDLPAADGLAQTPHFQWFRFEADYGHNAQWGWCPTDAQAIEYMSNNPTALKTKIANFIAHDGTGTQNAMKWALGLLDGRTQPLISDLSDAGHVLPEFSDRPREFGTAGVMKVIVLMSDGNTTQQARPSLSAYDTEEDILHWAENSLGAAEGYTVGSGQSYMLSDRTESRGYLTALCQMAKDEEVIVFTIGFDIAEDSYAHTDLAACASSSGNFYDVNGVELAEAFASIATTISKLRLVY